MDNNSLELSYTENIELNTENTINIDKTDNLCKEIEFCDSNEISTNILSSNDEDLKNEQSSFFDANFKDFDLENKLKDLNLENKSTNIFPTETVLYMLKYISRDILDLKKEMSSQKNIQILFNYCFVELKKNKNEDLKILLLKIYNLIFCDEKLEFTKELNFIVAIEKFKQRINCIKEILNDLNNTILKFEMKNLILKNDLEKKIQTNEDLKLQVKNSAESFLKYNFEFTKLNEKFIEACKFIKELNEYFGYEKINITNESDMILFFKNVRERIEKISEENEKLKSEEKKKNYKETINNLEKELLQYKKENYSLKAKILTYKKFLIKLKTKYIKLEEEDVKKENKINEQNLLLKFLKNDGNNFSKEFFVEKTENIRKKLLLEKEPAVKKRLREDLMYYEKISNDLKQLRK